MRPFSILIALLFSTSFLNAQERWSPNPMSRLPKEQQYKVLRAGGVVVIGAGTALFTAVTNAEKRQNRIYGNASHGNGLVDISRLLGKALGVMWIAGGTTMTVMGNYKLDKLKKIKLTTDGHSVGVAYTF